MGWIDEYDNDNSVNFDTAVTWFDSYVNNLKELCSFFTYVVDLHAIADKDGEIYTDDDGVLVLDGAQLEFVFDEITTKYIIKCGNKKTVLDKINNILPDGSYKITEVTRVRDARNSYQWNEEPLLNNAGVFRMWDGDDRKIGTLTSPTATIKHSTSNKHDSPTEEVSYNDKFQYYTIPNFLINDRGIGAWGYLGEKREHRRTSDYDNNYFFNQAIKYGSEVGEDRDSIEPWYYSTYPTVVYDGLVENTNSNHNTGLVQRVDEGLWQINGNDGNRSIVQANKINMLCFERGDWTKDTDEYSYVDYFDNYHWSSLDGAVGGTDLNWWMASKICLTYQIGVTGNLPNIKGKKTIDNNNYYFYSSILDSDLIGVDETYLDKILYSNYNSYNQSIPTQYERYPYYFGKSGRVYEKLKLSEYINTIETGSSDNYPNKPKPLKSIIPLTSHETNLTSVTRNPDTKYNERTMMPPYEGEASNNTLPFLWVEVNGVTIDNNKRSVYYSQLGIVTALNVHNYTYDWFFAKREYDKEIGYTASFSEPSYKNSIKTTGISQMLSEHNGRKIELSSTITISDPLKFTNNHWDQQKTSLFVLSSNYNGSGSVENSGHKNHVDAVDCKGSKVDFDYKVSGSGHVNQHLSHAFKVENLQIQLNELPNNYMRAFIVDDAEPTVWFKQTLDTRQNPPAPAYEVYYGNNFMQKGTLNLTLYKGGTAIPITLTLNSDTESTSQDIFLDGVKLGKIYWDGPGRSDSTKGCIVFEKDGDSWGAWSGFGASSVDLTKNDLNIDISTLSDSGVTYKASIYEYGQPITLTATSDGYIPYVPNSGWSVGGTIHAWVYTKETNLVAGADWQYNSTNNIIRYKGNRPHI